MLPDLFKDSSRLIANKYIYNNDIDKLYSLLPQHKEQCLQALDELEHLAKLCHI